MFTGAEGHGFILVYLPDYLFTRTLGMFEDLEATAGWWQLPEFKNLPDDIAPSEFQPVTLFLFV